MAKTRPLAMALAILATLVAHIATSSPRGVMFDAWEPTEVALDDYLLTTDFVVIGDIGATYDPNTVLIPVHISAVHIGALPHTAIVLINIFPHAPLSAHSKVLAWGTWSGSKGDTCFGNALPISATGELVGQWGYSHLKVNGRSAASPGSVDALTQLLARRESEHPAFWLTQGTSIMTVKVTAINREQSLLRVEPLQALVGTPTHIPSWLRLSTRNRCRYVPTLNDSLIIATTSADTLLVPVCMNRLKLRAGDPTTLVGAPIQELSHVYTQTDHGLALRRIYGEGLH